MLEIVYCEFLLFLLTPRFFVPFSSRVDVILGVSSFHRPITAAQRVNWKIVFETLLGWIRPINFSTTLFPFLSLLRLLLQKGRNFIIDKTVPKLDIFAHSRHPLRIPIFYRMGLGLRLESFALTIAHEQRVLHVAPPLQKWRHVFWCLGTSSYGTR